MTPELLVNRALQEIGAIPTGSSASASELDEALDRLVWLFDQYSIDGLIEDERSTDVHEFTTSKLVYTVGSGGETDIDFDLPPALETVLYRASYDTDPSELDQVSIRAISRNQRSLGTRPYLYVVEKGEPSVLRFEAPPEVGAFLTVIGTIWLSVDRATMVADTDLELPRGYARALTLALALELAPAYGQVVNPQTVRNARRALTTLRLNHLEPQSVQFDEGLLDNHYRGLGGRY